MMPETEPLRETRAAPRRRGLFIALGCVLWLGVVGGLFAIKFREFVRMRDTAWRSPPQKQPPPQIPWSQIPAPPTAPAPPVPKGPTPAELEAKARAGDASSALQLARLLEQRTSASSGALKVAFEWRLRAAEQGDAMAMAGVAYAYRLGLGVERSEEQAVSWMERAVAAGDAGEWSRIGRAFQSGLSLPQDSREAATWYRRVAGKRGAFDLTLLDTTPRVVFQQRPRYPFELRRRGVGGEVVIDFLVDQDGNVQNAYAVRSTVSAFEDAAIEAVSAWRFEPGRKNGTPVITHMQVPIIFTLDETPPFNLPRKSP